MTNKLLTLEEIARIEATFHHIGSDIRALLATARAYWELEKAAAIHLEVMKDIKKEDKPHAPTIKVIMEALGYIKHVDNSTGAELAIKSLEKHLE